MAARTEPKDQSPGGADTPASAYAYAYYANEVTPMGLVARQASSVFLMIFLYTAAWPFAPLTWLLMSRGAFFFDRFFSSIVLFIGMCFQWRIASLTSVVYVQGPATGRQILRNGRLEASTGGDILYMWQPSNYWAFALCEFVLLYVADYEPFGEKETLKQIIVLGVLAGLWVVGWFATPQHTKAWAFEQVKRLIFWAVLSEIFGFGGHGCCGGRPGMRPIPGNYRRHL